MKYEPSEVELRNQRLNKFKKEYEAMYRLLSDGKIYDVEFKVLKTKPRKKKKVEE